MWGQTISLGSQPFKSHMYICCIYLFCIVPSFLHRTSTGPHSAVGNVSGNRCKSDCRSRCHEFYPGPVPYFSGD